MRFLLVFLTINIGLVILWFVAEFSAIKRGHSSWDFVQKIYDKYNLGKVNW